MAPNNFSTMLHRRTNKITRVLIYAILEWTLIFLLLLNSLFSYFILKFALYFGLKPPCFLCSRIDHFLDSKKKEKHGKQSFSSYSEIICEEHAAEISKIGYCSHHRKLVESQSMCDDCSNSTSCAVQEDDVAKRCSCCDEVINISSFSKGSSSLDFVIKERDLLGGEFSDQKVQESSDQFDDSKFGYQILGDGAEEEDVKQHSEEEEVISEAEKEPLLHSKNDSNYVKNKEIFTTQNVSSNLLPQHLDFYIDHDDYRLIPVELVDESSIQIIKKDEKGGTSREFELVFDGYELVLPKCEATASKDLPSIHEEEENVIENLQIPKDNENIDSSENFELILEGDELVRDTKIENLQISQDVDMTEGSENFELNFEDGVLISKSHMDSENLSKEEETATETLQIRENDEEEEDSVMLEEQKEISMAESALNLDELESNNQVIDAYSQVPVETHSNSSESKEDNASYLENKEIDTEEKNQNTADKLSIQESDEGRAFAAQSSQLEIETERHQNPTENPLIQESEEGIAFASQLSQLESETERHQNPLIQESEEGLAFASQSSQLEIETERHQNPSEKPLIHEFEEDLASHLRNYEIENGTERKEEVTPDETPAFCKEESHTIADNVVPEVSTSCSHDADVSDRGLNVSMGMSQNDVEEEKVPDTPTSSESLSHLHRKLTLLGRRESATEESLDGMSMISEQESTETMEKLKVDLLSERKALRALYKELEEERNASAVAASQTMAMITRLQEEKATMQMEALQYQRMMEEQSEYDQEALQMMNELVVKREKEKQEVEKELEVYRKKVMDYEEKEKLRMLCRRRSRNSSASCSYGEESDGLSVDLNQEIKDHEEDGGVSPHSREENGHQDTPTEGVLCLQDSLSGFEEERQAILEQLKVLEEKLFTLAEEEEEHLENMKPFEQFCEENGKEFDVTDNRADMDSNGFIHTNGKHQQERRINGSMQKRLLPLFDAADLLDSPNGDLNGHEDELHLTKFELEKKRFAIEEEVDHVYERLQALEADREFLKHCIGSLRKGDKGLDLLQEILQHLRDLKNVEVQALKNSDQCASV